MIEHGIPKHDFFAIAQPISVIIPTVKILNEGYKKPIIEFQDPNSKVKYKAELQDTWTYSLSEVDLLNSFCLLTYGIESRKLLKVLEKRYPEITESKKVRFLLLKKI